jgi:hypothetical protein
VQSAAATLRKLAPLGDRVLVKRVVQEVKVRYFVDDGSF